MNKDLLALCAELEGDIKKTYEDTITVEEAEKLAGKFLVAQMKFIEALSVTDLDARMRKSGLKAVKASVYMETATKTDKKPSDAFLQNVVDLNEVVQKEQDGLDKAEVAAEQFQNYLNIFKEAHVYFRQISKQGMSG